MGTDLRLRIRTFVETADERAENAFVLAETQQVLLGTPSGADANPTGAVEEKNIEQTIEKNREERERQEPSHSLSSGGQGQGKGAESQARPLSEQETSKLEKLAVAAILSIHPKATLYRKDRHDSLHLHHVNGGGVAHREEVGNCGVYLWAIRNNFPPTLEPLCVDCHQAAHRELKKAA